MSGMTQRQENLISAKPGHRIHLGLVKLKMTFSNRTPNQRKILEDWENIYIVPTKQYRGIHKDMLHQPQNTNSLRDPKDNTAHMTFKGEPAVKLHGNNIEVGTGLSMLYRSAQH